MMRFTLIFMTAIALVACSAGDNNGKSQAALGPAQSIQAACNANLKNQTAACSCVAKASMDDMDPVSYAIALDLFTGTVSESSARLAAGKLPYAQRKQVNAYFKRVGEMCTGEEDGVSRMVAAWGAWKSKQASPEFKTFLAGANSYIEPKQSASAGAPRVITSASAGASQGQSGSANASGSRKPPGAGKGSKNDGPAIDGSKDRGNGLNGYN